MGLMLVRSAYFHAEREGIGHAATRLLVHMAATAYDEGNSAGVTPCLYFESRAKMAHALGVKVPDRKPGASASKADRDLWTTGNSRVKRAIAELVAAGAIEHLTDGVPGFNACFRISVSAVDPELLGPLTGPHDGPLTGPHDGPLTGPVVDRSPVPQARTAPNTETAAQHHFPAVTHFDAVDNTKESA